MKTYYMFGDSLMRGVMPDEAWNYHSSDAIGFEAMQAQYNMKFLNFAMPTFTSERVKMWLTQIMSNHPVPDVAFLECGGNDCDYNWKSICEGRCDYEHRHRVAPQDFKKNYENMIHLLQEKGVAVTAVIAPPIAIEVYLSYLLKSGVDKDIMSEYVNSVQQMQDEYAGYGDIMRDTAKENGCEILSLRESFLALGDMKAYYSKDGMHPNHQGKYDALGIILAQEKPCGVLWGKKQAERLMSRQVCGLIDAVVIDLDNNRDKVRAIMDVTRQVKSGRNFLIFPEGGYTDNKNELQEFQAGCFSCSLQTKTPIVPIALFDSYKSMNSNTFERVDTQVHFLKPILYSEYGELKKKEVAKLVKSRIEERMAQIKAGEINESYELIG